MDKYEIAPGMSLREDLVVEMKEIVKELFVDNIPKITVDGVEIKVGEGGVE